LTGYNTDIEYKGTVYHVQTEDKGRSNPFVESLVYTAGEILYSRRTPYHDLVEQDVDAKTIATLMERQHRTIAEAIRRGRLAQLTGGGTAADEAAEAEVPAAPVRVPSLDEVILDYLEAQRGKAHLVLKAVKTQDFVYAETVMVKVSAMDSHANSPQVGVEVKVLFKSTAEPRRKQLAEGLTDAGGIFQAEVVLPPFNGGTSAVVISAVSDLGSSEIKHLVHR
jgi:hypothetical protein